MHVITVISVIIREVLTEFIRMCLAEVLARSPSRLEPRRAVSRLEPRRATSSRASRL